MGEENIQNKKRHDTSKNLAQKTWKSQDAPGEKVTEINDQVTIGNDNSIKGIIKTPLGPFEIVDGKINEEELKATLKGRGLREIKLELKKVCRAWEGMFNLLGNEMSLFVLRF